MVIVSVVCSKWNITLLLNLSWRNIKSASITHGRLHLDIEKTYRYQTIAPTNVLTIKIILSFRSMISNVIGNFDTNFSTVLCTENETETIITAFNVKFPRIVISWYCSYSGSYFFVCQLNTILMWFKRTHEFRRMYILSTPWLSTIILLAILSQCKYCTYLHYVIVLIY